MERLAQFSANLAIEHAIFMTVAAACLLRFCPNYFGTKKIGSAGEGTPKSSGETIDTQYYA
jgi:hypothetical protein